MPDAEYLTLPQFLRWMMVKYTQLKAADLQVSKPAASRSLKAADLQLSKPAASRSLKAADLQVSTLSRSVTIKPA